MLPNTPYSDNSLNKDYRWDYRFPDTSTVFFRIEGEKIIGGVYEMNSGVRSQRIIAVPRDHAGDFNYTVGAYERRDFDDIIRCIEAAI